MAKSDESRTERLRAKAGRARSKLKELFSIRSSDSDAFTGLGTTPAPPLTAQERLASEQQAAQVRAAARRDGFNVDDYHALDSPVVPDPPQIQPAPASQTQAQTQAPQPVLAQSVPPQGPRFPPRSSSLRHRDDDPVMVVPNQALGIPPVPPMPPQFEMRQNPPVGDPGSFLDDDSIYEDDLAGFGSRPTDMLGEFPAVPVAGNRRPASVYTIFEEDEDDGSVAAESDGAMPRPGGSERAYSPADYADFDDESSQADISVAQPAPAPRPTSGLPQVSDGAPIRASADLLGEALMDEDEQHGVLGRFSVPPAGTQGVRPVSTQSSVHTEFEEDGKVSVASAQTDQPSVVVPQEDYFRTDYRPQNTVLNVNVLKDIQFLEDPLLQVLPLDQRMFLRAQTTYRTAIPDGANFPLGSGEPAGRAPAPPPMETIIEMDELAPAPLFGTRNSRVAAHGGNTADLNGGGADRFEHMSRMEAGLLMDGSPPAEHFRQVEVQEEQAPQDGDDVAEDPAHIPPQVETEDVPPPAPPPPAAPPPPPPPPPPSGPPTPPVDNDALARQLEEKRQRAAALQRDMDSMAGVLPFEAVELLITPQRMTPEQMVKMRRQDMNYFPKAKGMDVPVLSNLKKDDIPDENTVFAIPLRMTADGPEVFVKFKPYPGEMTCGTVQADGSDLTEEVEFDPIRKQWTTPTQRLTTLSSTVAAAAQKRINLGTSAAAASVELDQGKARIEQALAQVESRMREFMRGECLYADVLKEQLTQEAEIMKLSVELNKRPLESISSHYKFGGNSAVATVGLAFLIWRAVLAHQASGGGA